MEIRPEISGYTTLAIQDYVEHCLRNKSDDLAFDTSNWFERARSTGININDLMDAWETEKTAKISKEDIDELL